MRRFQPNLPDAHNCRHILWRDRRRAFAEYAATERDHCDPSRALLWLENVSQPACNNVTAPPLLSFAGLRRLVAVLCAFAFLTVGMAHALTECDGIGAGSQTVVSNVSPTSRPARTGHAVPCDHCYGCTGAVAPLACVIRRSSAASRPTSSSCPLLALHAHAPGFHTPPPKSLT